MDDRVLHGKLPGETAEPAGFAAMDPFRAGLLLGLLIGEGHFGGDGRQPQVTVKMHVRHLPVLRWLLAASPGSRLYGPYHYDGRHFYQWMVRGTALRERLVPFLDALPWSEIDSHSFERYTGMKSRHRIGTGEGARGD